MSLAATLIQEVAAEAAITRRMLQRVPGDRLTWKPHAKSMTVGELALHLASEPGLLGSTAFAGGIDFAAHTVCAQPRAAAEILAAHDASVVTLTTVLERLGDEGLGQRWSATLDGTPVMTVSNAAFVRTVILNHAYHHRGQLSVYLRLLDVSVPSIYGPTADENPFTIGAWRGSPTMT